MKSAEISRSSDNRLGRTAELTRPLIIIVRSGKRLHGRRQKSASLVARDECNRSCQPTFDIEKSF
jgi:hypothetical protein